MSDNPTKSTQTIITTTAQPATQTIVTATPKRKMGRLRIATKFVGYMFGSARRKPKKYKHSDPSGRMPLLGHLAELRDRLIKCAFAVALGTILAAFQTDNIVLLFKEMSGAKVLVAFEPAETFFLYFKVALYAGALVASPIIVYQLLAFLAPALEPERQPGEEGYDDERRVLRGIKRSMWLVLPGTVIAFVCGVLFGYYVAVPAAFHFFSNFASGTVESLPRASAVVSFATSYIFWLGMVFELPIIIFMLAKLRLVTWKRLIRLWRYATVLAFVAAAFITPTPDPIQQIVIAIPILGLYWLGVLFARLA